MSRSQDRPYGEPECESGVHMQGAGTDAVGRDPATLDSATHLGALHDTDQGQLPRVPVQLDALTKPSKLTV
jgi:hypothetical protein